MRVFKKIVLSVLLVITLLCIGTFLYVYNHYVVPIIAYHSINDIYSGAPTVSPKNFERQIRCVSDNKYNVISLEELVSGIRSNKRFPRNTVVITFDDGFKDNYIYAYPVLKKHNLPATIFLISDFINRKPEHLNWQEVREMLKNRTIFGAHTRTHAYLPEISQGVVYQEIKSAKEQIETNIGQKIMFFSYPAGAFNEGIKKIVKEVGFKAACTTNRGFDKSNQDVYELKRIKVTDKDGENLLKFRMKLSGYYNIFRKAKTPY